MCTTDFDSWDSLRGSRHEGSASMTMRIAKKVTLPGYVGRHRWSTVQGAFHRLKPRKRAKWFAKKAWREALARSGGKWPVAGRR